MENFIDLHLHLDGSLSEFTIKSLMEFQYRQLTDSQKVLLENPDALSAALRAPVDCNSLAEYLTKFDLPCSLLQSPEAMYYATVDLLSELADEGVKYVEIRFAPQLHSLKYQNSEKERLAYERAIVKAVIDARMTVSSIKSNFILCCMRNIPDRKKLGYDPNYNTLLLAEEFLGKGVVAVDLAGAEARDETEAFNSLFEKAREMKIPFTIHAGEAGETEWRLNSLRSAIKFGAKRIGHGIALEHSYEMRKFCKLNNIGIECCPVSNLQTKAVVGGIEKHPILTFLEEDMLVSVNTDNRTVSNTNLKKEFELLATVGVGKKGVEQLNRNAIEMSFADEATKQWLRTLK